MLPATALFRISLDFLNPPKKIWSQNKIMEGKKGPYNEGVSPQPKRKRAADPVLDAIESGPLRGRRAVTLGIVKALREEAALLSCDMRRFEGIVGKFSRDRIRSIEHTLRILERVARLPADHATDYRGPTP